MTQAYPNCLGDPAAAQEIERLALEVIQFDAACLLGHHSHRVTDLDQAYAVGKVAVELALAGKNAVMPAIVRLSDRPYRWKVGVAPLEKVANVEKKLPRDYITADGFSIQ